MCFFAKVTRRKKNEYKMSIRDENMLITYQQFFWLKIPFSQKKIPSRKNSVQSKKILSSQKKFLPVRKYSVQSENILSCQKKLHPVKKCSPQWEKIPSGQKKFRPVRKYSFQSEKIPSSQKIFCPPRKIFLSVRKNFVQSEKKCL